MLDLLGWIVSNGSDCNPELIECALNYSPLEQDRSSWLKTST